MSQPDLSESVPCGRPRRTRTARTTPTRPDTTGDASARSAVAPSGSTDGVAAAGFAILWTKMGTLDVSVRRILLGSRPEDVPPMPQPPNFA